MPMSLKGFIYIVTYEQILVSTLIVCSPNQNNDCLYVVIFVWS